MEFNNKTLIIIGLIIGGLSAIYTNNNELACAVFGSLGGYLSHDLMGAITDEP